MRETWVHPVVGAAEAPRAWASVWRFRTVILVLLAVAVLLAVLAYKALTGEFDNAPADPNIPRAAAAAGSSRSTRAPLISARGSCCHATTRSASPPPHLAERADA